MRRSGFSLVEISVVLVVVATMLAGVLPYIAESIKIRDTDNTTKRMEAIEDALQAFFGANQFLPCPANITLKIGDANFGKRAATPTCTGGTPAANWSSGNVRGGGVPTKDLGLPDEYAFDGWGRRFYYHVDLRATAVGTFDSAGGVTINDAGGGLRTNGAVYAVVSAGRNGHGAYTRAGSRITTYGTPGALELENCGISGAAPCNKSYDAILVQSMQQPDSVAGTIFDDIVDYKLRGNLLTGGGGDTLWTTAGATDIYGTNLGGNVGIGTSAPGAKLDVNGLLRAGDITNGSIAMNSDGNAFLEMREMDGAGTPYIDLSNDSGTDYDARIRLTGNDALAIEGANVGIGTSAPAQMLDVAGQGQFGTAAAGARLSARNGTQAGIWLRYTDGHSYLDSDAGLYFRTNGGSALQNSMIITNTGRVGIGTTTPISPLHVQGSVTGSNYFVGDGSAGNSGATGFSTSNGPTIQYWGNSSGNSGAMYFLTSGAWKMQLSNAGNLGVGIVPAYKLDVNGTARINGTVHPISDRRLKEDIQPVVGALQSLRNMQGVSYAWKDKSNGRDGRDLGLIAQDVEKVVPDLVRTADDEQHLKSLNYDGFTALFVEAIKELDEKIEGLPSGNPSAAELKHCGDDDDAAALPNWVILGLIAPWFGIGLVGLRRR